MTAFYCWADDYRIAYQSRYTHLRLPTPGYRIFSISTKEVKKKTKHPKLITSCCLKKSDTFRACWISPSLLRYDVCVVKRKQGKAKKKKKHSSGIESWEPAFAGQQGVALMWEPPFVIENSNTSVQSIFAVRACSYSSAPAV